MNYLVGIIRVSFDQPPSTSDETVQNPTELPLIAGFLKNLDHQDSQAIDAFLDIILMALEYRPSFFFFLWFFSYLIFII